MLNPINCYPRRYLSCVSSHEFTAIWNDFAYVFNSDIGPVSGIYSCVIQPFIVNHICVPQLKWSQPTFCGEAIIVPSVSELSGSTLGSQHVL